MSGRARPPHERRQAAVSTFEAASGGPAARWAKEALGGAEGALREALLEWSRQEARLLPLRDYRPAAEKLAMAEARAREAERLGEQRRAEALGAAEDAVSDARAVEAHAVDLVAATALPAAQRARLQRARLLVRQAETFLREGEIDAALERAERSQEELRAVLGPALEEAERYTSHEQVATWRRWIDETRAWSRSTGRPAILVLKEKNTLVLLSGGRAVKAYDAEIGSNAVGVKRRQGDRATPEGHYRIVGKKGRGESRYHRALLLDYPNAADRRRFAAARERGEIPQGARIGGLIEIHGEGGRGQNWTEGCVALSNRDLDDLYPRVGIGTRVTIVGGDGSNGTFTDLLTRLGQGPEGAPR